MNRELRSRLGQRVDAHLGQLRQRTEHLHVDVAFVDRVMLAVSAPESEFLWAGAQATRRTLLVCGALVAFSLVWAAKSHDVVAPALLATSMPMEGSW